MNTPSMPNMSNQDAEESLLGAALLSPTALEVLVERVDASDFYKPLNGVIAAHLIRMYQSGINSIDALTVADEIQRSGEAYETDVRPVLISLQANTPATGNARHYAQIVVEMATLRRLKMAALEIAEEADLLGDVTELLEKARRAFGSIDMPLMAGEPDLNIDQFLAQADDEYHWLIDGLMEKKDRLLITASEGAGKSTLCRQVAICTAAGIHPLRFHRMEPHRVLFIDCENSDRQVRRKARALVMQAKRVTRGFFNPDNLRVAFKRDGLDLTQRLDVHWLLERCEANKPELLVIGPLYKLHDGDPNEEGPAKKVSRVLDVIRNRYGCGLLMEAHSPHGDTGRPYGASLWKRWPEFGYALVRDQGEPWATFDPWRGPRDERDWPEKLLMGGEWPWMEPPGEWVRQKWDTWGSTPQLVDEEVGF